MNTNLPLLKNTVLKPHIVLFTLLVMLVMTSATACKSTISNDTNDSQARSALASLLSSLENKDIESLREVMSPSGEMELIFTNGSILSSVDSFVAFHQNWFMDTTWTIKHEMVDFKFYGNFATATIKAFYNEPEGSGEAYFHNMMVTYVLHKEESGSWKVIKDQATTFDKSSDN